MIIKLPIIEDNKIIFSYFKLDKNNEYFILSFIENNEIKDSKYFLKEVNLIKILCFNNVKGIVYINLYLPLKIIITDKYLWTNYFFKIAIISDFIYKFDFFYELNNIINKKYNLEFINLKNINNSTKLEELIWKISNNEYNIYLQNNNFDNFDNYIKFLWEFMNLIMNMAMFLIFIFPNYTNKNIKAYQTKNNILKKIILIANIFKNIKYKIFSSNDYFILDHLKYLNNENIKNSTDLEINKKYFIKINKIKYILVNIDKIVDNKIFINNISVDFDKYEWYYYIPNVKISIQNIFLILFDKKEIYSHILSKIDSNIDIKYHDKIIDYFINKPILSNLYYLLNKFKENKDSYLEILKSNNYDYNFFQDIIKTYNKLPQVITTIKILFTNYNYPIKFNKYEIDNTFDNILYISLQNYKSLIYSSNKQNNEMQVYLINDLTNIIPTKVKLFYFNILKLFYQILNFSEDSINNFKFFYDNLYKNFIKIFFFENCNTINLLKQLTNPNIINKIKENIQNTFLFIDTINKLKWHNIKNKIFYLNILIKNKSLFLHTSLNKFILNDNYDNKIKSIILNPFEMFNYLNYENEFIEWILFFDYKINELFIYPISLSTNDIKNLGILIYYLYNILEQDFKDNYYNLFINHGSINNKIILYNHRINIKIKEYFKPKINLNLGILAKHLNNTNQNLLCYDPKNEIIMLRTQLTIMTTKYLKYKRKYNDIKNSIK